MSPDAAFERLVAAMQHARPALRDALAEGRWLDDDVLDDLFRLDDGLAHLPTFDLAAACERWTRADDAGELPHLALFGAAPVAAPVAEVVSLRRNRTTAGAYVVRVRCPFAADHLYQGAGHEFHSHGWRATLMPDEHGGIGTRVPHCEGATRSGNWLPNYELRLPDNWRERIQ